MKLILFLFFTVNSLIAFASGSACTPENSPAISDQILISSCEQIKNSPQCQTVYKRLKQENEDVEDYELKCDLQSLKNPVLVKLPSAVGGCSIGGWNFVTAPFKAVVQGAVTFKNFVSAEMESEKEINRKCDESIENKKQVLETFNLAVPQLLRVPLPSDQELASRSCAFLRADQYKKRIFQQRNLETTLGAKAFQKNPTVGTEAEQEYLSWYKQSLGQIDPEISLLNMARKALHDLDIRYECYNTVRSSALVCESVATELSGAMALRRPLFELAGIRNFEAKAMKRSYRGEQAGNSWALVGDKVKYLTREERAAYKVSIKDGKVYDANRKAFDTSNATTAHLEDKGKAIFVMDRDGNIYISNFQKKGEFHHSSLVGGEKVAAAGEIEIVDGQIRKITNRSGHYQPTPRMMEQFKNVLKESGVDISQIQYEFKTAREWQKAAAQMKNQNPARAH